MPNPMTIKHWVARNHQGFAARYKAACRAGYQTIFDEIVRIADSAGSVRSTELIELQLGKAADAPLCLTCGTKMRPAGSCYVCEGCGSTSGCS